MPLISDGKSKPLSHSNSRSIGVWMSVDGLVYLDNDRAIAVKWLERNAEASNVEQLNLARSASASANKANRIAIAALIIAMLSMILSAIGLHR